MSDRRWPPEEEETAPPFPSSGARRLAAAILRHSKTSITRRRSPSPQRGTADLFFCEKITRWDAFKGKNGS